LKKLLASGSSAAAKLEAEIARLACERYEGFLAGITRYCNSPVKRTLKTPPAIWQDGSTRLLDFGKKGEVVLVIPSLVNRYHVLDLSEDVSFVRDLAARGFHPLLVDWDVPAAKEQKFTIDDYMRRLLAMLEKAVELNKGPVPVIGYCMGGMLAAALAQLAPDKIAKLMFLATPWDFHAGDKHEGKRMQDIMNHLQPMFEEWMEVPVDTLQSFFILQQPFAVIEKFRRFGEMAEDSVAARDFVILEDWVNDGVPLSKPVGHVCLNGWYVQNITYRGKWEVMGVCVNPANLPQPSLHVIPARDRIVPPESAAALARLMPRAKTLKPAFGHVSMMSHAEAKERLWPKLFDWLASTPPPK
jgi:polyhydroxyalkanoate synthase